MDNKRLTAEGICGIWAGVTMAWDEDYSFDNKTYAQNTESMIKAGVHGIYTTGSTGEFYAIDYSEFCAMVDIQADLCGAANVPLQIGCCSDSTAKTIKLLEYVAGKKEVGAAQINIPYWMEVNDRELLQFFKDIYNARPDIPLVHYNIPRSNRFLSGPDYLKILEVAPNLIGVKFTMAGTNFASLQTAMRLTPNLSYFVGENLLASAMMLGARGCYSSLIATNPKFMLEMYDKAKAGRWPEAIEMQKRTDELFFEASNFIESRGEGTCDPVFDKGLSVAAGCVLGHQRCRPPYQGWSDETIQALSKWLKSNYSEFVCLAED